MAVSLVCRTFASDFKITNKMTTYIKNLLEGAGKKRHLQRKTLDRFALLAGFQSWNDLHDALQGQNDAQTNYSEK